MKKIEDMQKIYNILDEFSEKISPDGDNEFIIEFAERNLKEFVDNADYLIINLNRFTTDKSIKIAVYMYIFGLFIDYFCSDNSATTYLIEDALIIIVNLLSKANENLKAEREISEGYKYALDKLENTKWHKYPEDKPKKRWKLFDNNYL